MFDCIVELQNDSLFKFKVGEKAGTVGRHRVDLFVLPDHLFFLKLFFNCLASVVFLCTVSLVQRHLSFVDVALGEMRCVSFHVFGSPS